MGLLREFHCPLDGKKMRLIEDAPSTKAMNREFLAVRCANRQGGHTWMVSEDDKTFLVMRHKMGRE